MVRVRNLDTPRAKMKSPCPTAPRNRRSPAEAGLLGGDDPDDAELELDCEVPYGLGRASDDGERKPVPRTTSMSLPLFVSNTT